MFDVKINKDAPKGMTDDELLKKIMGDVDEVYGVTPNMKRKLNREEVKKEAMEKYGFTEEEFENIMNTEFDEKILDELDGEDILSKFDPKGRKPNAIGGIQRLQFKIGGTKKLLALIKEIKKLNPIEAMKEVNEVVAKRGKYENLSDTEVKTIFDETNDHIFERDVPADEFAVRFDEEVDIEKGLNDLDELNFTKDASQVKKMLNDMDDVSGMTPKMVERFKLKERFPGIDDRLLTQIIDDPDPQRKAEAIATIDQAFELMRQGKSQEEVYDIMKQMTDRTKQAKGGLQYLMGM
jgi:hypothetical protein